MVLFFISLLYPSNGGGVQAGANRVECSGRWFVEGGGLAGAIVES